ncbi:hypothetical protein DH2020_021273 [Rehmannia glutinosa]|uniref:Protein kinase domain-containing protein n=1 Tax=Rehmannia glutinosa TaxID=99300 RepID=A0ABR0WC78_REHGL
MRPSRATSNDTCRELLNDDVEDEQDGSFHKGNMSDSGNGDDFDFRSPTKRSEEILMYRLQHGLICREFPVKETHNVLRSEDENGNKTINEYVRERKIGAGSYGKVVLYTSRLDGSHYAIKRPFLLLLLYLQPENFPTMQLRHIRYWIEVDTMAFHKSHLMKLRVAPSETAMTDVFREILIMKVLSHPNIVNLVEVIDDPTADHLYMVLEYVDGKWVCEGAGPPGGLGEETARKYLRDVVSGLMYLHAHDDNDELHRSPGTPVFTAPECCLGPNYHGKAADTWAVGVTLYCMVLGKYPFLGDTLQDTYEKNLLEGLLCKDPRERMTLENVAQHAWVVGEEGPLLSTCVGASATGCRL